MLFGLVSIVLASVAITAWRGLTARRFALRQLRRRPGQVVLVVCGAAVGTAIVVSSFVVGDILQASVAHNAELRLGPVDEVVAAPAELGDEVIDRLAPLRVDPEIDSVLDARRLRVGVANEAGQAPRAEPNATLWELDFGTAERFGGIDAEGHGSSGITGPSPEQGHAVVNSALATPLGITAGQTITVLIGSDRPATVPLTVDRVIPAVGLGGLGDATRLGLDVFVPHGFMEHAPGGANERATSITLVSNAGGVLDGADLSDSVTPKLSAAVGDLTERGVEVTPAKRDLLDFAEVRATDAASLLLSLGGFAIVAGVLLVVSIFAMLAAARTQEIGMLRAIGMKRRWVVAGLVIEGTAEALVASAVGALAGVGVAWAMAATSSERLAGVAVPAVVFDVRAASLLNGFALGFLVAFGTLLLTSVRVGRVNTVAAIRDLPADDRHRLALGWVLVSTVLAVLFGAGTVAAAANDQDVAVYLLPGLAVLALCPLLVRLLPRRLAYSIAAAVVLAWALFAVAIRPSSFDTNSAASVVVLGVLAVVAGVVLLEQNHELLARGLWPVLAGVTRRGFASRLALSYPVARRARTGAILIMYGLVVFTLVLITTFAQLVAARMDRMQAQDFGGYALRVDFAASDRLTDPAAALAGGRLAGRSTAVVPLTLTEVTLSGQAPDGEPLVVVGADPSIERAGVFPLDKRLPGVADDATAWQQVLRGERYVMAIPELDVEPGTTLTLTGEDGRTVSRTVAGVLKSSLSLSELDEDDSSSVVMSAAAARAAFGARPPTSALIRTPADATIESDAVLAADLQGEFRAESLVVKMSAADHVRGDAAQNSSFFQMVQGFLAAGLLIGIAGLGIMMMRAVHERRRDIGVLRSIGARSGTVRWAVLGESAWVALEGTILGAALAILTAYQVFKHQAELQSVGIPFTVPWLAIAAIAAAVVLASVAAGAWPARRASHTTPALALRRAD